MASLNPEYLINEITHLGTDIRDYIKTSRRKESSEVQFNIVLNQKIKEFSDKNRQLIMSQEISLEKKISTVVALSPVISEALTIFPAKYRNADTFLDLTIIHNFLVLNIAGMGRLQDIWRLQASANILTKLLVGVPRISDLPDFTTVNLNEIDKTELVRIRNALSLTAGLFLEAVIGIYNYTEDNLVNWSSEAFYNFNHYKQMISNVDLFKLATDKGATGEQVFLTYRTFLMPTWNALVLLLNMSRILGENWPDEIEYFNLISKGGTEGVIEYIDFVRNIFNTELGKLYDAFDNGRLTKNDNPRESIHIKRMVVIEKFAKLYQIHLRVTRNLIHTEFSSGSYELDNLIIESYQLKDKIDMLNPNAEDPFNSEMLPFYHDLFELIIPQLALQSFLSNNTEPYALIREYYHRIKNAGAKTILLHYLALKGEIAFYLRGIENDRAEYLLKELEELKEYFQLKHREYLDINILEILILLKDNKLGMMQNKIKNLREIINDLRLAGSELQFLESYLDHMENGTEIEIETQKSVYDYHTWLIPDIVQNSTRSIKHVSIPAAGNKIVRY